MSTDNPEISQAERRGILRNDARVREGATFRDFADSGVGNEGRESGRFKKLDTTPVVHPLPANSPWSGAQPQPGDEPAYGVDINKV